MGMAQIFLLAVIFLNLAAALFFVIDKKRAAANKQRYSENSLLVLSFLAPVGAIAGMKYFRHKTTKIKFKILVPLFLCLHIIFPFLLVLHPWFSFIFPD